jgi:hypothetical protein
MGMEIVVEDRYSRKPNNEFGYRINQTIDLGLQMLDWSIEVACRT